MYFVNVRLLVVDYNSRGFICSFTYEAAEVRAHLLSQTSNLGRSDFSNDLEHVSLLALMSKCLGLLLKFGSTAW